MPRTSPLREAHAHLADHGWEMSALHLDSARDLAHALDLIRTHGAKLDASREPGWLRAVGVRVASWPDPRWPTRAELDAACPSRPALIASFDHHGAALNAAALRAAGFDDASPNPPGGVLVRDSSGALTGLVLESAYVRAQDAMPQPTPAQWRTYVRDAAQRLHALGFAEVHDLLAPPWLGACLASLHDAGELPIRVHLFAPANHIEAEAQRARAYTRPGAVALAGGKLFADGTLNGRTAWMLTPYESPMPDHPTGTALLRAPDLAAALARCHALGLGLAVHAIGDGAVRGCLDAAETTGLGRRLRIEHAELIDEADVPRFARLGVTASVQPCHLLYDIEVLRRHLPHRLDRVLPLRDLIRHGLEPGRTLIFGSDVPIVPADPSDSIQAAVQRRRPDMPAPQAIAPTQALREAEAWACFSPGE